MSGIVQKTKGVSYVGKFATVWDRYTLFTEGRRVIDILVDLSDASAEAAEAGLASTVEGATFHRIYLAPIDGDAASAQPTKGFALSHPHLKADGVEVHVDRRSVEQYIMPRRATMIARVYVPAA